MFNKSIFLLSVMLFSITAFAQSDFDVAQRFMSKKGVSLVDNKKTRTNSDCSYQIFHGENDKGFAIVVNNCVVGYSTENAINEDNLPDALKAVLNSYPNDIKGAKHFKLSKNESLSVIPEMIKSKWGQGHPFNLLCPQINGRHCVTGCSATAVAQMLYHYKLNVTTKGFPSYQSRGMPMDSLPPINFRWNDMLDTYKGKYSESQASAVAELMLYCGYSCGVGYGLDGTAGAATDWNFVEHFGFNNYSIRVKCGASSDEEWEEFIYRQLKRGKPVMIEGHSLDMGHYYIIDGFDGDNMFHINWGWSGGADGYYNISRKQYAEEGIFNKNVNYMLTPIATILIRPDEEIDEEDIANIRITSYYDPLWSRIKNHDDAYRNDKELHRDTSSEDFDSIYITHFCCDFGFPRYMDCCYALFKEDSIVKYGEIKYGARCALYGGVEFVPNEYPISFGKGLENGEYKIYGLCRLMNTDKWYKVWDTEKKYVKVVIKDNTAFLSGNGQSMTYNYLKFKRIDEKNTQLIFNLTNTGVLYSNIFSLITSKRDPNKSSILAKFYSYFEPDSTYSVLMTCDESDIINGEFFYLGNPLASMNRVWKNEEEGDFHLYYYTLDMDKDAVSADLRKLECGYSHRVNFSSNPNCLYYIERAKIHPPSKNWIVYDSYDPNKWYYFYPYDNVSHNFVDENGIDTLRISNLHPFMASDSFEAKNVIYDVSYDKRKKFQPLIIPFDVDLAALPSNFEVYEYKNRVGNMVEFAKAEILKANTPYLLKIPSDDLGNGIFTIEAKNVMIEAFPKGISSVLYYNYVAANTSKTISNVYVINEDGTRFDLVPSYTTEPMTCYFQADGSNDSYPYLGISSTTNSINDITYGNTKSTDTYNMLGQKVGNSLEGLPKGVYIMNGKKSVVR